MCRPGNCLCLFVCIVQLIPVLLLFVDVVVLDPYVYGLVGLFIMALRCLTIIVMISWEWMERVRTEQT